MERNPNIMANMMVEQLNQIIGQEEEGSPQIKQAKSQVLVAIIEKR